jgi:hypothetical protein
MRGDWQIAAWLLPWVRGRSGQRVRNPISALSRWKIFDNLRRSLVPVAMLLVLLFSWFVSPAVAAAALLFPGERGAAADAADRGADLLRKPVDLPLGMHLRVTLLSLGRPLAQNALTLVFLPYEAYVSADAIVRTLVRIGWTNAGCSNGRPRAIRNEAPTATSGYMFRAMAASRPQWPLRPWSCSPSIARVAARGALGSPRGSALRSSPGG